MTPLPQSMHGAQIIKLHYNDKEDHFIAVCNSSEVRIVSSDLIMNDAGLLITEQLSILSSCWLEQRQELVTSGGNGSLRYFSLKRQYAVTTTGRQLLSRLVPRMTIQIEADTFGWMRHLCCDESERRLFAASENTVVVWSILTGEQLQRLTELHEMSVMGLTYCSCSRHLVTTSHDGTLHRWTFNPNSVIEIDSMRGHSKRITSLASALDGKLLFSGAEDGTVRVWNSESAHELFCYSPSSDPSMQALAHHTPPPPSIIIFTETRNKPTTPSSDNLGSLYVISGAYVSVLEASAPVKRIARASDLISKLSIVNSSRGMLLPTEKHALLFLVSNNTLQINGWADGQSKALIMPTPSYAAVHGVSTKHSGADALADAAATRVVELYTCSYEPCLGCLFACWKSGAIDLLELPTDLIEASARHSDGRMELRCVSTLVDRHLSRPASDACVLPTRSAPQGAKKARIDTNATEQEHSLSSWQIVSGDTEGRLSLWMVENAGALRSTAAHSCPIVALLPLHTVNRAQFVHREGERQRHEHKTSPSFAMDSIVISLGGDGSVHLWDLRESKFVLVGSMRTQSGITAASLRDSSSMLVGFDHGALELWKLPSPLRLDTGQQKPASLLRASHQHHLKLNSISCSLEWNVFLTASADCTAVLWSLDTCETLRSFIFAAPATHAHFVEQLGDGVKPTQFVVAIGENLNVVDIPASAMDHASLRDSRRPWSTSMAFSDDSKRTESIDDADSELADFFDGGSWMQPDDSRASCATAPATLTTSDPNQPSFPLASVPGSAAHAAPSAEPNKESAAAMAPQCSSRHKKPRRRHSSATELGIDKPILSLVFGPVSSEIERNAHHELTPLQQHRLLMHAQRAVENRGRIPRVQAARSFKPVETVAAATLKATVSMPLLTSAAIANKQRKRSIDLPALGESSTDVDATNERANQTPGRPHFRLGLPRTSSRADRRAMTVSRVRQSHVVGATDSSLSEQHECSRSEPSLQLGRPVRIDVRPNLAPLTASPSLTQQLRHHTTRAEGTPLRDEAARTNASQAMTSTEPEAAIEHWKEEPPLDAASVASLKPAGAWRKYSYKVDVRRSEGLTSSSSESDDADETAPPTIVEEPQPQAEPLPVELHNALIAEYYLRYPGQTLRTDQLAKRSKKILNKRKPESKQMNPLDHYLTGSSSLSEGLYDFVTYGKLQGMEPQIAAPALRAGRAEVVDWEIHGSGEGLPVPRPPTPRKEPFVSHVHRGSSRLPSRVSPALPPELIQPPAVTVSVKSPPMRQPSEISQSPVNKHASFPRSASVDATSQSPSTRRLHTPTPPPPTAEAHPAILRASQQLAGQSRKFHLLTDKEVSRYVEYERAEGMWTARLPGGKQIGYQVPLYGLQVARQKAIDRARHALVEHYTNKGFVVISVNEEIPSDELVADAPLRSDPIADDSQQEKQTTDPSEHDVPKEAAHAPAEEMINQSGVEDRSATALARESKLERIRRMQERREELERQRREAVAAQRAKRDADAQRKLQRQAQALAEAQALAAAAREKHDQIKLTRLRAQEAREEQAQIKRLEREERFELQAFEKAEMHGEKLVALRSGSPVGEGRRRSPSRSPSTTQLIHIHDLDGVNDPDEPKVLNVEKMPREDVELEITATLPDIEATDVVEVNESCNEEDQITVVMSEAGPEEGGEEAKEESNEEEESSKDEENKEVKEEEPERAEEESEEEQRQPREDEREEEEEKVREEEEEEREEEREEESKREEMPEIKSVLDSPLKKHRNDERRSSYESVQADLPKMHMVYNLLHEPEPFSLLEAPLALELMIESDQEGRRRSWPDLEALETRLLKSKLRVPEHSTPPIVAALRVLQRPGSSRGRLESAVEVQLVPPPVTPIVEPKEEEPVIEPERWTYVPKKKPTPMPKAEVKPQVPKPELPKPQLPKPAAKLQEMKSYRDVVRSKDEHQLPNPPPQPLPAAAIQVKPPGQAEEPPEPEPALEEEWVPLKLSFWASDWDDDEIDWDEIDFMDVPESIFDLLLRYQSIMQQIHRRRMLHTYVEMDPVVRELITELEGQAKNLAAEIRSRAQALLPNEAPEEAVGSKHIEDVQPVEETVEEQPQEEEADIEEEPEQLLADETQRQIEEDEALIAAFKSGALNVSISKSDSMLSEPSLSEYEILTQWEKVLRLETSPDTAFTLTDSSQHKAALLGSTITKANSRETTQAKGDHKDDFPRTATRATDRQGLEQVAWPAIEHPHLIAAAALAMANADQRKKVARNRNQIPMGLEMHPNQTPNRLPSTTSRPLHLTSVNPSSSAAASPVAGWGTDGTLVRREPLSDGVHLSYARRKVVHSVPTDVKPMISTIRPSPKPIDHAKFLAKCKSKDTDSISSPAKNATTPTR